MFHSHVIQGMAFHFDLLVDLLVSGAVDLVTVVFRPCGDEFRHIGTLAISFQFISQVAKKIAGWKVLFSGFEV